MRFSGFLFSILFFFAMSAGFAAAQRDEPVLIFDSRRVSVAVPAGFTFASARDRAGLVNLDLADAEKSVSLQVVFLPDPEGQAMTPRSRKERMVELFDDLVAGSVEKAMRFEELEPRTGAGTYCAFTDAKLVGQTTYPPGEYLHLTVGVKAWRGVMVVFRLFSNDLKSAANQAALKLLRESIEEKPVPLR
jgi:hypothetical protein